jgi:thioredoxin reductase (NADPH)
VLDLETAIFVASVIAIVGLGLWHSWHTTRRVERRDRAVLDDSIARGLDVPASLHPVIDPAICIGSRACVDACPEKDVLGLIRSRGRLVAAANCIGHGRCAASCPVDAIKLVFGTATRGVELPQVSGEFESSVPGLYIAGELGGMGLIANAFEQAIQAVDAIASRLQAEGRAAAAAVDVLIAGAGPAGLAASLRAQELGLSYLCVDQARWGGAVRTYPRAKIVMTRPVRVPLYGPVKLNETSKEALLGLWDDILDRTGVQIRCETRVAGATRRDGWFDVELATAAGPEMVRARRVLLGIGRRGSPRTLGVPGDDGTNVTTHLIEPEKWAGKRIVVVGGGDVACETALALADQPGTEVTLLYRGEALSRPRAALRERLAASAESGRLRLELAVAIQRVEPGAIVYARSGDDTALAVDQVFACLGGTAPTAFLQRLGVDMVTKYGEA